MSVSGKNVCGWTVEAGANRVPNENMNIIVDRSQMSPNAGSMAEKPSEYLFLTLFLSV